MQTHVNDLYLKHLITVAFLSGSPTSRPIWHLVKEQLEEIGKVKDSDAFADLVLSNSVNHPEAKKFPRNAIHVNRFLKWVIDIWSSNQWSGAEKLLFYLSKENAELEISYNTYFFEPNSVSSPLTLLESNEGIARGTTGLSSWGASRVLASWCLNNISHIKGDVLELGSGIGFTASSILSSSDSLNDIVSYTATDYHPHVLSILHHNLSLLQSGVEHPSRESLINFSSEMNHLLMSEELPPGEFREWKQNSNIQISNTNVKVQQLDWRDPKEMAEYDVVLGADVVYAVHLFPHLINVIRKILTNENRISGLKNRRHSKAFVACTRRNQETLSEFLAQIQEQQLQYKEIYQSTLEREESLFGFDESHLPIKIYQITA